MVKNIRINLHGCYLDEAKEKIIQSLNKFWRSRRYNVLIIHGHNNGVVLRNYIRSKKFISDMKVEGHQLMKVNEANLGDTLYILKNVDYVVNHEQHDEKQKDLLEQRKLVLLEKVKNKVSRGEKLNFNEARELYGI